MEPVPSAEGNADRSAAFMSLALTASFGSVQHDYERNQDVVNKTSVAEEPGLNPVRTN